MKKSDRLNTLVALNAEREKQALEAFGASQQKQLQLKQQLESLDHYRRDYQGKLDACCDNGVRIGQLLEFRAFIEKLDRAIGEQQQGLSRMELELNGLRSQWVGLHQRGLSLEKIRDSARLEEIRAQEKRIQSEQDDRVSCRRRNSGMRNA